MTIRRAELRSTPYFSVKQSAIFLFLYKISLATALPTDVRRWLCPAVSERLDSGLCPRGAAPIFGGGPVTEGHSRFLTSGGKAVMGMVIDTVRPFQFLNVVEMPFVRHVVYRADRRPSTVSPISGSE